MANGKNAPANEPMMEEPVKKNRMENIVDVYIPRIPGEDPNMFVALNGVRYLIGRGKTSKVPEPVAKRALEAEEARNRAMDFFEKLAKTNDTELARL